VRYGIATIILIALVTTGCRRSVAGCLKEAEKIGVTGAQATELCTTPCEELSATYGISREKCVQLQFGPIGGRLGRR
jgi:hypothetical protein